MGETVLTLAIETSNPTAHDGAAGVALIRAGESITRREVRSEQRHADPLMPAIDQMMRDANLRPSEIDRVAVSVGPGGFTSCRTAVTTAKVICRFTGARAIPVPTELAALEAIESEPDQRMTICLAWKRDAAWVRTFEPGVDPSQAQPGRMEPVDSLSDSAFGVLVCDDKLRAMLPEARTIPIRFDPVAVARVSARIDPIDPLKLAVAYPREPEAVRKWRELGR